MLEQITGIVDRVTYHNPENGWSVLKVKLYGEQKPVTVTVHQSKVFAGATIEFRGNWTNHPSYGKQFKATEVNEKKPATIAALEKYIGSGLIYGIGPAIAKRIVKHFGDKTLEVFENDIKQLIDVSGISDKKLEKIIVTWNEHRAIRDVMMFLQQQEVSTLFAVKIYKEYGNESIKIVTENPYRLSKDIYGIGFFSADKIALGMGLAVDSDERVGAAILHILSESRAKGHCFLIKKQICEGVKLLLNNSFDEKIEVLLSLMEDRFELKTRKKTTKDDGEVTCYYNKSLFFDELITAQRTIKLLENQVTIDEKRAINWLQRFDKQQEFQLSEEQFNSVISIVKSKFSILTGGPGCGKTTTTKALVALLRASGNKVLLAAPTGRAAQRMSEVIGMQAKTIHRLLIFNPKKGGLQKNIEDQLEADFIIIDESSMLDISLTASLLSAINNSTKLLLIGDVDQLPSIGAGNVLKDLIDSKKVPCFSLTKIFRQAEESMIIKYAHGINRGITPDIVSPFANPEVWKKKTDCLFIDAEEATQDQLKFISRSKNLLKQVLEREEQSFIAHKNKKGEIQNYSLISKEDDNYNISKATESEVEYATQNSESFVFNIPNKFRHVQLDALLKSKEDIQDLKTVLKKIHPWSSLNYGLTGSSMILKLYNEIITKYFGKVEIQILSPMTKGSLGTWQLNKNIQATHNPPSNSKKELIIGDRVFREGDRVIQLKNNYTLNVFNGDIGVIKTIDLSEGTMEIDYSKGKSLEYICYDKSSIIEVDLAYAITIHKSQGSEFDVIIIPITMQHYNMLFRNLMYTGLTRGKKLTIFVGTRVALSQAVRNIDNRQRQTMLKQLIAQS